jgi:hypothetical protein
MVVHEDKMEDTVCIDELGRWFAFQGHIHLGFSSLIKALCWQEKALASACYEVLLVLHIMGDDALVSIEFRATSKTLFGG